MVILGKQLSEIMFYRKTSLLSELAYCVRKKQLGKMTCCSGQNISKGPEEEEGKQNADKLVANSN